MKKDIFQTNLSIQEKAVILAQQGTLLLYLQSKNHRFLLFSLHRNFVEVVFDFDNYKIQKIQIVSFIHVEKMYLQQLTCDLNF